MKAPILGLSYTEVIADLNIITYATRSTGVDNTKWKMLFVHIVSPREQHLKTRMGIPKTKKR